MNSAQEPIMPLLQISADIHRAEQIHRKTYLEHEKHNENTTRILVDNLISSIYLSAGRPIPSLSEEGQYQILLGAAFIRTHFLLHNLILDGHLIDSQCLLRKQLEHLARLRELDSSTIANLKNKTPNVSAAPKGAGRIYGAQSKIAHFTDPSQGLSLLQISNFDSHAGVTALPQYSINSHYAMNSRLLLGMQFGAWFIMKLKEWYPEKDLDSLNGQLRVAVETAINAGIVIFNED